MLFRYAPAKRKVESLVVATGFGLCAMKWREQTSHYISAATRHACAFLNKTGVSIRKPTLQQKTQRITKMKKQTKPIVKALQTPRAFNATSILAGMALILSPVAFAGQFEPPINYFLHRPLNGIASGDFNGDGNTDLAVTGCGNPNCTITGSVFVLLGKGNGQFTLGGRFAAAPGTDAIALSTGDFNRDGTPDLVVVNNAFNQPGSISILLGDGSGGFLPPVSYRVGGAVPVWPAVADFNRDGNPDLAISVTTTDSVAVLLGNGDGTFEPAMNYTVGGGPQGIATGDVNGDGFPRHRFRRSMR